MNSTDNELQLNIIFYCQLAHDGVRVRLLASLRQLFVVLRTEVSHLHPIQIYYIIISVGKVEGMEVDERDGSLDKEIMI